MAEPIVRGRPAFLSPDDPTPQKLHAQVTGLADEIRGLMDQIEFNGMPEQAYRDLDHVQTYLSDALPLLRRVTAATADDAEQSDDVSIDTPERLSRRLLKATALVSTSRAAVALTESTDGQVDLPYVGMALERAIRELETIHEALENLEDGRS